MDDQDDTLSTLTQEGSVLGTLDYLSPEQALDAHKADIRSDLYSLGCTFYFVLTGQVPFAGGTATEKLLKHRLEEPTPVEKRRPEVPAQVGAVVRKLMAKRPEDRYQTPAELVADLTGKVGRQALAAPPADGPTLADGGKLPTKVLRPGKRRQRWPWIVGGVALLFLPCCAGLGLALLPKPSHTDPQPVASNRQTIAGTKPGQSDPKPTQPQPRYVKMSTREETILATLKSAGLPTLQGKWHAIGYFPYDFKNTADMVYPPENEINLKKEYPGKNEKMVGWKEFTMEPGHQVHLDKLMMIPFVPVNLGAAAYLYHEFDVPEPIDLPLAVGGEDSLLIWLNGERVFRHVSLGGPIPASEITLRLKGGKNRLLVKSCNGFSKNTVYICPQWPAKLAAQFGDNLKRDFPK
jgi:hypothetical protein